MSAPFRPAIAHGSHLVSANDETRSFADIESDANADARSILRAAKETQASIQAECDRCQSLELARMQNGGFLHG
jgi:hypothetical protein